MLVTELNAVSLPEPARAFVLAVNAGDREAIVDTFAERALVVDELRAPWRVREPSGVLGSAGHC